ncbi:nitroreductase family deazaflavin-dependent oxidoreductase [Mycobacterium sp. 050134]|uniref:nitroreductase family deazaflavin-dependent oxidoreductase n=1 Tax=Mycobacterium sp. 050134 TaxID=3096111 RepID=UPI002EDB7B78
MFRTDTVALKVFNDQIVEEFRANDGKVGGIFEDYGMLLLTSTGAKSGKLRMTPLAYFTIDGSMVVVGSRGGAPNHPDWVHNLRANPIARVEAGAESFEVTVNELHGDRRAEVFAEIVAMSPNFGVYQSKTSRVIPLFELHRRTA